MINPIIPLNILIVAGDSLIGKNLAHYLREQNIAVQTTTKRDKTSPWYFDLSSSGSIATLLVKVKQQKINTVVILAAITGEQQCRSNVNQAKLINVENTCRLLQLLNGENIFTVYMSTSQVFDHQSAFIKHDMPYSPVTLYGEQKVAVEKYIIQENIPCAIVRATKVISADFLLFQQLNSAVKKQEKITLFNDYCAAPISINYLCDVLTKIMRYQERGIYQLSGQDDLSYFDMAKKMLNAMGLSAQLEGVSANSKNVAITPFGSLSAFSSADFDIPLQPLQSVIDDYLYYSIK